MEPAGGSRGPTEEVRGHSLSGKRQTVNALPPVKPFLWITALVRLPEAINHWDRANARYSIGDRPAKRRKAREKCDGF